MVPANVRVLPFNETMSVPAPAVTLETVPVAPENANRLCDAAELLRANIVPPNCPPMTNAPLSMETAPSQFEPAVATVAVFTPRFVSAPVLIRPAALKE